MANYLYNGVELPALPEWDKVTYPYALLYDWEGTANIDYMLLVTEDPFYCVENYKDGEYESQYVVRCGVGAPGSPSLSAGEEWKFINGEWVYYRHSNAENGYYSPYVWSNYDILVAKENIVTDGSGNHTFVITNEVKYPASDPVPVGGAEWKKHDAYKPNTEWDGNTFYKAIGNKWIKHDAYDPQGGTP